jgi:hypothetical protein
MRKETSKKEYENKADKRSKRPVDIRKRIPLHTALKPQLCANSKGRGSAHVYIIVPNLNPIVMFLQYALWPI